VKTAASFADIGPFEKMVSFEISSVDLNHAMNRASRRISREVNIAGFRPGKAPRRMVENRVGFERIKSDALEDLVPARMGTILSETDIHPVVPPLMESVTDTGNGAVKVEVRVTTWPRIESVPAYRGKEIEVQEVPPVSEEVDARLTQLRHMYAPLQTVNRPVQKGDFVVIDMTVEEEGRLIEALALDGFSYEVGSARLTAEIDEGLVGQQAGDKIELEAPLPEWFQPDNRGGDGAEPEPSQVEAGETVVGSYEITIAEVQSRSLPEIDDEWASEYTGHDSLEELKEEMRVEVEERRNATQWEMLVAETLKEMTSDLELELPERLEAAQTELLFRNHLTSLEKAELDYTTYLERTGMDHEQFVQGLRGRAVAGLKARVLIEGVIEEEGLLVEDTEVLDVLRKAAQEAEDPEQFRQEMEKGVHTEQIRSDMLRARAQAFMALHVQPVGPSGQPVRIEAPAWVKAWFDPLTDPAEISNQGGEGEALYEAEVINDPNPD
jgi:trigger factor